MPPLATESDTSYASEIIHKMPRPAKGPVFDSLLMLGLATACALALVLLLLIPSIHPAECSNAK